MQSAAPTSEPASLAEAKNQLGLPAGESDHDNYLSRLITLGREQVESDTGMIGFTRSWVLSLDTWPADFIQLDKWPLISVTSIAYLDTAGSSQAWSAGNYDVDISRERSVVFPSFGITWPAIRATQNAITVTYVAGHATVGAIPQRFRQAVLAVVSREFLDRQGSTNRFDDAYHALIPSLSRASYP